MKFESYIQSLIRKKIIPGISVLVASEDRILHHSGYGQKALEPEKEDLPRDTLYDTASLTKPLITAFLTAYLIEHNHISLDTRIKKIFPDFTSQITIAQLLTHSSGLPAWYPFFLYPEKYLIQLSRLRLESLPGQRINYSCPGYILLYFVIEAVSGRPYPELAAEIISRRLNLERTFLKVPAKMKAGTAPTERGNRYEKGLAWKKDRTASRAFPWRQDIIRGDTHDLNSHHLGGTAGNSGLFSCAHDLFLLTREFFPDSATILKPESVRMFWANFSPGEKSHRSLGFKLNTSLITSGGKSISPFAIGHSGFTGTSIWLEPEKRNVYILLSNRIHPIVKVMNFNRCRRRIHGLIKSDFNLT